MDTPNAEAPAPRGTPSGPVTIVVGLIVAIVLATYVARRITQPLRVLGSAADKVALLDAAAAIPAVELANLVHGWDGTSPRLLGVDRGAPADFGKIRAALVGQGLREPGVQRFGDDSQVLIRLEAQPTGTAKSAAGQAEAVNRPTLRYD